MKIGIDLRALLSGKVSGVPIFTREVVVEMIKSSEHEFVLFLVGWDKRYAKIFDQFDGPNVKKIFWRVPNRIFNFSQFFMPWPKVDLGVDVFFMPDMRPINLPKKVKKVCMCHDLSYLRFPHFFSLKSRFWYLLNRPKKYFREASKVISVSHFTVREVKELIGVESSVVYEAPCLSGGSGEVVKGKYLLSLSTIEPRKNLKRVIEAFEKADLDGVELIVAGDFDNRVFAKLKLPEVNCVRFIGHVPESDKEALYKSALGLVYVSLYEGFGLPVLEAFQCGCPVLTSKDSPMQEIAGDLAIYADPLDIVAISDGMKKLVSLNGDRQKLIAKANEFSWEKTAKEILLILSEVVVDKN
jgi:glycosyltransferase involved in cell wall biosynthesis